MLISQLYDNSSLCLLTTRQGGDYVAKQIYSVRSFLLKAA